MMVAINNSQQFNNYMYDMDNNNDSNNNSSSSNSKDQPTYEYKYSLKDFKSGEDLNEKNGSFLWKSTPLPRWISFILSILLFAMIVLSSYMAYTSNETLVIKHKDLSHLLTKVNEARYELSMKKTDLQSTVDNIINIKDDLKTTLEKEQKTEHNDQNHDLAYILDMTVRRNEAKVKRLHSMENEMKNIEWLNLKRT